MTKVNKLNLERKVRYIFNDKKDSALVDLVVNHYGSFIDNTWDLKEANKFDKVIWKSASTKESEGKTFFILNGQVGAQTLKALSLETNEDLSNGLFIFGLIGGASSQIIFPILTEISRFENALIDLSEICQGIKTKY